MPSVHYFYVKTKMLTDFQMNISVPLSILKGMLNTLIILRCLTLISYQQSLL